ncbi:MAG: hypothetical protein HUJ73_07720, partial [Eubacterium sp.]|nr:hypothetical protein [Eubacterium sp.]
KKCIYIDLENTTAVPEIRTSEGDVPIEQLSTEEEDPIEVITENLAFPEIIVHPHDGSKKEN